MSETRNAVELLLGLWKADGVGKLCRLPGLWERRLDDKWVIWVNGHEENLSTPDAVPVSPYECYIEFNGWPAGSFSIPTGKGLIAAGTAANYETFCDALERAVKVRA